MEVKPNVKFVLSSKNKNKLTATNTLKDSALEVHQSKNQKVV